MPSRAVVFTNMMRYFDGDEDQMLPMTPVQMFAFNILRGDMDDAYEEYERTAAKNRANARKRVAASGSQWDPVAATGTEGRREKEEGRRKKEEGRVQKEEERGESAEVENGHTKQLFIPPSVEEVAAYCAERKNGIQAQRFVDFYAAKGWRIGKEAMHD